MSGRRRDMGSRLERTLQASALAAGCPIAIVAGEWVRWSSASFDGGRHSITIDVEDRPATHAWLAALPETDLPIPGHLVADLVVAGKTACGGGMRVVLEVLTVEAC